MKNLLNGLNSWMHHISNSRNNPRFDKYLRYCPETGNLIRTCTTSPKARTGDVAGYVCGDGYLRISVEGTKWKAHQIVFWMHHGYIPKVIDHIDRNILNNRIENLRDVSAKQNLMNVGVSTSNTSGYKGVHKSSRGKYVARISENGVRRCLGTFNTPEDAARAYNAAALRYHGEFAYINKI